MALFRKKGETLDLTELQKRGLLKITQPSDENHNSYFDLSTSTETSTPTESTSIETPSPSFDFLDALANSSSQTPQTNETSVPTPSFPGLSESKQNSPDLQDVHVKIDNFEYKLDRLHEKLDEIEKKLKETRGE